MNPYLPFQFLRLQHQLPVIRPFPESYPCPEKPLPARLAPASSIFQFLPPSGRSPAHRGPPLVSIARYFSHSLSAGPASASALPPRHSRRSPTRSVSSEN